jgi:hypothetical protein
MRKHTAFTIVATVGLAAAVGAAVVATAGAAPAAPKADLGIVSIHPSERIAHVGDRITIRVVAVNHGPRTSELDVEAIEVRGLHQLRMDCRQVSPDTPFCEYASIAPGHTVTVIVHERVTTPENSDEAIFSTCVNNEGQTRDANPANDCSATRVIVQ